MANEIIIVIKARNETTGAFESLKREAALAGDDAGETITHRITEKIKVIKDDPTFVQSGAPIGDALGRTISDHVREKVKVTIDESFTRDVNGRLRDSLGRFVSDKTMHEKVKVDVDVDEQTFSGRLRGLFDRFKAKLGFTVDKDEMGTALEDAISGSKDDVKSGLQTVFGGDVISSVLKSAGIGTALVSAFAIVGPTIASGLALALGGGTIALGIASAIKDPTVSSALNDLKAKVKEGFSGFGDVFRGPTLNFINRLPEVFKPLQPMIAQIKADLAPVAMNLSNGVIGFLQNVLPSIGRAIDKSAPIINVLADKLPGIGDAIARMIDNISSHPKETAQFFNGLLKGIELLLRFIGVLVTVSFGAYKTVRAILTSMVIYGVKAAELLLDAFIGAFGWVPGVRSKLDAAKKHMDDFSKRVVHDLNAIPDSKDFTLYIRTVGTNAGATLSNIGRILGRAAGGITGSASGATPSGLTWVGEHGPELLAAPAGSRVYSNPDSMRMAGGGGGGGGMIVVPLVVDGHTLATAIIDPTRRIVRDRFGGSAQNAFGYGS